MSSLFLSVILLFNSPITIINDELFPFFVNNYDTYIEIYCRYDYEDLYKVTYYPENDNVNIIPISDKYFSQAGKDKLDYHEKRKREKSDFKTIFNIISERYELPYDSLVLVDDKTKYDLRLSTVSFIDEHSKSYFFLILSDDNNFYIKNYDNYITSVEILDNYLLLIEEKGHGFTIKKIKRAGNT